MHEYFRKFAVYCSDLVGSAWTFLVGLLTVIVWAISGPVFHYSNTWQLVINTGTTIVTFLMVFLIQNAQNREAKYTQLKLDELLCAIEGARTKLIDLDSLSDEDLVQLEEEFMRRGRLELEREQKKEQLKRETGRS
ncbi:MAG TPA: low affinity iron permease family protein [Oxalicibacterium sp.]|jgi:low affinity Fe/Cu permease|nr:low affinity iron permease family protein [Oxalicibacterium sp.]